MLNIPTATEQRQNVDHHLPSCIASIPLSPGNVFFRRPFKSSPDPTFCAVGLCFWTVWTRSCAINHSKGIEAMAVASKKLI